VAKQKYEDILLDAGDVLVVPFEVVCVECENAAATKRVVLDIRNAGLTTPLIEPVCVKCAQRFALRVRRSLPKAKKELKGKGNL